jgi:hypothetical protein
LREKQYRGAVGIKRKQKRVGRAGRARSTHFIACGASCVADRPLELDPGEMIG